MTTLEVRGGSFSIAANFEHLRVLARTLEESARALGSAIAAASRTFRDPVMLAPAVLDPAGAAEVAATAGVVVARGATAIAECESLAAALRAAAAAYEYADDIDGKAEPLLAALRGLPAALLSAAPRLTVAVTGHRPREALQALGGLAQSDPALIGAGVGALASGFWAPQYLVAFATPGRRRANVAIMAGRIGARYADGRPALSRGPSDFALVDVGPPRSVADLIAGLELRDRASVGGGIDVRIVSTRRADGGIGRAAVVDLPGTKDWSFAQRQNPNVANIGTNLRALANESTSYELGIVLALRSAGVRPGEPVMLVGHSQGGMVAARLAADLAKSTEFRVTHLVTAGSPIGLVDVPRSIQVLSIENTGDVVPGLDAAENRRHSNQITVRVDRGGSGFGVRHSLHDGYLPGARDIDASNDPSLRAWRFGAGAFLDGDTIESMAFQIDRLP